ncbi:hypothetical protein ABIF23_001189 [Bradyrhizobium elkanii]
MALDDNESDALIGSDKVEGTAVYGADGNKVGTIERLMIDKTSGKVSYAVLSFGGFLGIGDDHYPLPWQSPEVRHQSRRLRHRHNRKPIAGRAKVSR